MTQPLGGDTVTLVRRVPRTVNGQQVKSARGVKIINDDTKDKPGCVFVTERGRERVREQDVTEIRARCRMPVDTDTAALTARDAIRFGDLTYEMQSPAIVVTDLNGDPDHVKAYLLWTAGDSREV